MSIMSNTHVMSAVHAAGAFSPTPPPGMTGLTQVIGWAAWAVLIVCVLGFLGGGAYLVIGAIEGREVQGVKIIGISLVAAVMVGSAATWITTLTGVTLV